MPEDIEQPLVQPKWWLDSTTVKALLKTLVSPTIVLLSSFGVKFASDQTNAIVDFLAALFSLYGFIEGMMHRNSKGPLSLTK